MSLPSITRRGFATGTGALALVPPSLGFALRAKEPPIAPATTLKDQVDNVKHGWTADGLPSCHAATLLPASDRDYYRATFIANCIMRGLEGKLELDDRVRTAVIAKCIQHLHLKSYPEKLTWLYASKFLERRPHALFRPLTLHDYADLWDIETEALEREEEREILAMLDDLRVAMSPPPYQVLWSDGSFEFVKLTHPFHVFESGWRSLDMLLYARGETERALTPDQINRLSYWLMIQKGCCLMYSLRIPGKFMHTATIIHTPVRTMLHTWHAETYPALVEVAAWMRERHGPRHFMGTRKFHIRFLVQQTDEHSLPWGPEHDPDHRITARPTEDGWRIRGRRRRRPVLGV